MTRPLTTEEQQRRHRLYLQNDLYRQWLPILTQLHRDCGVLEPTRMWQLAEQQMARLREVEAYRAQEIAPIYTALLDDCAARCAADTVMCIMLTMLMNAVEKGHEDEYFDNEPMCMAILDLLGNAPFPQKVMERFYQRQTGYDGKPVVITPLDYMTNQATSAAANEKNEDSQQTPQQQAVKAFVDKIIRLADAAYEAYNGQSMKPAANRPEVEIVIRKDELAQHMQQKMRDNFDELLALCYPEDAQSKKRLCQYVRMLMEGKTFFGKLPKNRLAPLLAPIVGLTEQSTRNRLSQD